MEFHKGKLMTNACLWHMGFSIIWLVLQSLSTGPPCLSNESAIRPWDSLAAVVVAVLCVLLLNFVLWGAQMTKDSVTHSPSTDFAASPLNAHTLMEMPFLLLIMPYNAWISFTETMCGKIYFHSFDFKKNGYDHSNVIVTMWKYDLGVVELHTEVTQHH